MVAVCCSRLSPACRLQMLSSPIQNKEDSRSRFTLSQRSDGYFYLRRSGDLSLTVADPRAHWQGQGGWSRDTLSLDGNSSNTSTYIESEWVWIWFVSKLYIWMGSLFWIVKKQKTYRLSAFFTFSFWFLTTFWVKCKMTNHLWPQRYWMTECFFLLLLLLRGRKKLFQSHFVNGFLRKLPGLAGALPQLWRTDYNNNWL